MKIDDVASQSLHAYIVNDTNNYYDQLTVTVKNNSTNYSETFYLRGSSYDTSCDLQYWYPTASAFSNASVTIRVEVSSLGTSAWRIDHVALWSF